MSKRRARKNRKVRPKKTATTPSPTKSKSPAPAAGNLPPGVRTPTDDLPSFAEPSTSTDASKVGKAQDSSTPTKKTKQPASEEGQNEVGKEHPWGSLTPDAPQLALPTDEIPEYSVPSLPPDSTHRPPPREPWALLEDSQSHTRGGGEPMNVSIFMGKDMREELPFFNEAGEHGPSQRRKPFLARAGAVVGLLFVVMILFLIDAFWEPLISPRGLMQLVFSELDQGSAIHFLNVQTRSLNMLLASMITVCAIAIPLTANNYTQKLILLFVEDRINQLMFGFLVLVNIFCHWVLLASSGTAVPKANILLTLGLGILCFTMVIPYAFYVFRSLQPEVIVSRIQREILVDLNRAPQVSAEDELLQIRRRILANLKYLSSIAFRSIDRHDRDTALFSLESLRYTFDVYFRCKGQMPESWFQVSRADFPSKPRQMRQQIERGKTFFEAELMEEFALILTVSMGGLHEVVRMLGATMRHIGYAAFLQGQRRTVELTFLYLNSFVRAALVHKDAEALFILVYHYRRLAERMLLKSPNDTLRVGFYLDYYAHQALRTGMNFVPNLIAYDIATLVQLAYECNASCKEELFALFVRFDREDELRNARGVIKSQIRLATIMRHMGFVEEAEEICRELGKARASALRIALVEIAAIETPLYWEVTERRYHNDYIPPSMIADFEHIRGILLQVHL